MDIKTTCLIPFFNESSRLIETLKQLIIIKEVDEIVCVNDGSNDDSVFLLKKYFPHIKLVNLKNNQGKTEAVRQGLKKVKTTLTFLLDADLKNISALELGRAINFIKDRPILDMLILQRICEPFIVRFFRFDTILSGQRIIKSKILSKILKKNISHYDLEVAMNEYFKSQKQKVNCFPISAINTRRLDKWGLKRSLITNILMIVRFIKNPGIIVILRQMIFFAYKQ